MTELKAHLSTYVPQFACAAETSSRGFSISAPMNELNRRKVREVPTAPVEGC